MQKRPIYIVVMPTGKIVDGEELVVIIEVKLSRTAADLVSAKYEGSEVRKFTINA